MRVEQLCRFRTDDVGYRVFAKSPGITQSTEANHAKFFTSGMDPLFKVNGRLYPGRSVLTFSGAGEDFFIGMSTMRSDISSRPSIFHHTYRISTEDYAELMKTDPGAILGIDVSGMFTSQHEVNNSAENDFDLSELNCAKYTEDELRSKYNLTNERYANLLVGAYRAVTTGQCLKLITTDGGIDPIAMVKELAYCIAVGMPPAVRRRITLSSAMDTKVAICVSVPNGGEPLGKAAFEYNIDTGALQGKAIQADVLNVFLSIADMTADDRSAYFAKIEKAANVVIPVELMNYELFLASHYLSNGDVSGRELTILAWMDAANSRLSNNIKLDGYYRINSYLLKQLNNKQIGINTFVSEVVDHYIEGKLDGVEYEHEAAFERELIANIDFISEDTAELLLNKLLILNKAEEFSSIIHALFGRVRENKSYLNSEQVSNLAAEVNSKCITELLDDCMTLVDEYNTDKIVELTKDILDDSENRRLNDCEKSMLNILVSRLIEAKNVLEDGYCDRLDSRYLEYDDALNDTCVAYLILVRLQSYGSIDRQYSALLSIKDKNPGFFGIIEQNGLRNPEYNNSGLGEMYRTSLCFEKGRAYRYDELLNIINKNNVYRNAEGCFEKQARKVWLERFVDDLANNDSLAEMCNNTIAKSIKCLNKADLSDESLEMIRSAMAAEFWKRADCGNLVLVHDSVVPQGIIDMAKSKQEMAKATLYSMCRAIEKNPQDSAGLVGFILNNHGSFSKNELYDICTAFATLAGIVFKNNKRFISWDLLLLSRIAFVNDRFDFDYDAVVERVSTSSGFANATHTYVDYSHLINTYDEVCRGLKKAASKRKTAFCIQLEKDLKPSGGFIKKLFGKEGK